MTYPIPNYSRIWVRGRFIDLPKAARAEEFYGIGQPVIFTPSPKVLLDQGTGQIISTGSFKVDTDKTTGYFAIQLPATDDPDIIPFDFTYKVTEPSGRAAYDVKIPINTPFLDSPGDPLHGQRVLDLISVVPAPSPSAGTVQLLSGRGVWDVTINSNNELVGEYTDGVTFNAGVVSVGSVNGKQGTVVLNAGDVGLANVNNTSDANKPVSTAQSTAISTAVSNHVAATDPHTQYYNQTRGDARYRKITDLVTVPANTAAGLSAGRFIGVKPTGTAGPTGFGTNSGIAVGDMLYNVAGAKWQYCTAVTATTSTWAPTT